MNSICFDADYMIGENLYLCIHEFAWARMGDFRETTHLEIFLDHLLII